MNREEAEKEKQKEGGREERRKGKKKEKDTCIIKESKTHAHVNNVHIVYMCNL